MFQARNRAISGHMGPEVCSPTAALQPQCGKNHLMPSICVKKDRCLGLNPGDSDPGNLGFHVTSLACGLYSGDVILLEKAEI